MIIDVRAHVVPGGLIETLLAALTPLATVPLQDARSPRACSRRRSTTASRGR